MPSQDIGSVYSGQRATIVPGEPMSRAGGQYGKGHSYLAATPIAEPSGMASGQTVRDQAGGMKRHPRSGGVANNTDYGKLTMPV